MMRKVNFCCLFTCFKSGGNKLSFFLSSLSPKRTEIFPELVTCALSRYFRKEPLIFRILEIHQYDFALPAHDTLPECTCSFYFP